MIKTSDKLILDQAILRHKEREDRQKREITLPHGPGWVTVGSVHDCNRDHFEKLLRAYWDRLYVGWNPMKNGGRGCWEVWQRPSLKTPILAYHDEVTGLKIWKTEYRPNDFEHWVADLDYLNYSFIEKLKKMDSWENKQLISQADDEYEAYQVKLEKDEEDNIRQVVKENKKHFRDLLDYVQSGYEPTQFFRKK